MYAAVPSRTPTPVILAGDVIVGDSEISDMRDEDVSASLANPKSSTFTAPSDVTLIFAGFRSR
jgi:hypothetical protein